MADEVSGGEAAAAETDQAAGAAASHSRAGSCAPASSGLLLECDSSSDDEAPVEVFDYDEQETEDVTAKQHQEGRDLQGIPWERLQVSREQYRRQRLDQYRNYMNCIQEQEWPNVRKQLISGWPQPTPYPAASCPFDFVRNWRAVCSSIVHFQLRNLLWCSSAHDVFVVYDNRVQHWNAVTRSVGDVLDLRGAPKGPRLPGVGRVQVSTLCVSADLLAAGGFSGELVLSRLNRSDPSVCWEEQDLDDDHDYLDHDDSSAMGMMDTEQTAADDHVGNVQQQQQHWCQMQQGPLWGGCAAAAGAQQPGVQQEQQQPTHQQPHCSNMQQLPADQLQQQIPASFVELCRQQRQPALLQHQQRRLCNPLLGAAGPSAAEVLHSCRVTQSENGITNGIEIFRSCSYGECVITSNNDCCVRIFDIEGCRPRQRVSFPFAVNYATVQPDGAALGGGPVAAVVGDDPLTWLIDCRSGLEVMKLKGHRDFSFAAAWHPAGHLLATGNQDSTTHVWDVRQPSSPLTVLAGRMGAIRSLRFSADGAYLAAAEPADFVHVYDVTSGFSLVQNIELFGELAGISFSPDAEALFVAISDTLYSSLVQYQRASTGPQQPC